MKSHVIAAVLLFALSSCGPSSPSPVLPMLPVSGDQNTAKPTLPPQSNDPWSQQDELIEAPTAPQPRALEMPEIERFVLGNGLKVLVLEDHSVPIVTMRMGVRAGARDEGSGQPGLSRFVAAMLDKGNGKRSAAELTASLEDAGGALVSAVTPQATYVSCRVLSENAARCLDALRDVAVMPGFPESELPAVRQQLISEVRARHDDVRALAAAHLRNAIWGDDHYRGRVASIRSIESIDRDALKQWHARLFKPNNSVLVIAGDVDTRTLRRNLGRAFNSWRRGRVAARAQISAPEQRGMTVRLVDRPKLSSSKIALGHVGVSIADSDFYDVVVFDHALGGAANSSRLAAASRDGSVEEANSAFDKEMERGAYWLTSSVRSRDTLAAVDRLLEEMRKMAKQGPKKTEVTGAIGAIAGGYPMAFQSPDGYARALLDAELQGLGDDYVRDFAVRVGEVTVAKAAAAARARLMPDDVSVVIVGSAAKISPALERRGWKYEVISHLEPISAVERARDADGGEPREVSQADSDAANKILSKALAKKGGARLASLRSFRLRAKATLTLGQQSVPVELARVMVRPDKLQLRMKAMGGTQIITLAGDSGWVAQELGDQRKAQDIGAADLQAAKSQLWRDQELVLLRYKDEDTVAQLVDSSGEHHVIDLRRGRWEVRLFINKKSYLLDKMTYQEGGELSSESYSDYRDVEGVLVAHRRKTTQKMMGQSASFDIALESFELNPTVSPTTFSKGTGSP